LSPSGSGIACAQRSCHREGREGRKEELSSALPVGAGFPHIGPVAAPIYIRSSLASADIAAFPAAAFVVKKCSAFESSGGSIMRSEIALEQRLLTVDEFHAMGEAGILDEDDRVELIDGRIITMTPIGGPHMECVNRLARVFITRTPAEITVSVQNPVRLGTHQEPQPDIALLRPGGVPKTVPTAERVLLIVEVADTSLEIDRQIKVPRYAAAGIPETWVVSLPDETLAVFRQPGAHGYAEQRLLRRGDQLSVEALPSFGELAVDEVLGA
jgi:Uma2 family endonuclease